MINYNNIEELEKEFEEVVKVFWSHHSNMEKYHDFYLNNVFYAPKNGQPMAKNTVDVNLLKIFADKNIHYTSPIPSIKVVPPETSDFERERASMREKIVVATMQANNWEQKQKILATDGTLLSQAFVVTEFNHKKRCVEINRYDPRYCYYQYANDNDNKLVAFWVAYPMTKDQIKRQYGVVPTHSFIDPASFTKQTLSRIDGKDWFMVVKRFDDEVSTAWVGNKFITKPYKHHLGVLPVDVSEPLPSASLDKFPDFFLRPLVSPQAEFNETLRMMANIVRKLGNPTVWGKGVVSRQFESVDRALRGDGAFIGLKGDGELGILQLSETRMLNDHLDTIFKFMKYQSGFGNATFGESVGANTSGDAINMYSQPTTRAIDHQMVSWKNMYESIGSKILRYYDNFLKTGEAKSLSGYMTKGTYLGISEDNKSKVDRGGYNVQFTKEDIAGEYGVLVTPPTATPKDDIAYKRLVYEAVVSGFMSRTTGYEEWGMQSPQDELELLETEQAKASLNPDGNLKNAQADAAMYATQTGGQVNEPQSNTK